MLDFFGLAERFLDALMSIGDFLLYKPFTADFIAKYDFLLSGKNKFVLMNDANAFADLSVGAVIFGVGLCSILIFKLIKFFVDIVT